MEVEELGEDGDRCRQSRAGAHCLKIVLSRRSLRRRHRRPLPLRSVVVICVGDFLRVIVGDLLHVSIMSSSSSS